MSGCVNCVWDVYREEVEEWSRARGRLDGAGYGVGSGKEGREGEEGRWGHMGGVGVGEEEGLFEGVPVGIREFMSMEKKLRERRGGRGD